MNRGITHLTDTEKHSTYRTVCGGSLQLRRIMLNLMSNAIWHNKPNGSIDTHCRGAFL
ncbi:MAG: hypothetical protein ACLTTJ_14215 [Blautia sp.]